MAKIKVKVLLPFVVGEKSYGHGDEISLDQEVAYSYALSGAVEFRTQQAFDDLDKKIKEGIKAEAEEKAKREKEAEAILYKEELEKEKAKLEKRVAEINEVLGIKG